MKTTLDVQDGLLAREKRYAKEAARPLHKVVEDGLRKVLAVLLPRRMNAGIPRYRHARAGLDTLTPARNLEAACIERQQAEAIAKVVSHGDACPRPRPGERAATKVVLIFKETR